MSVRPLVVSGDRPGIVGVFDPVLLGAAGGVVGAVGVVGLLGAAGVVGFLSSQPTRASSDVAAMTARRFIMGLPLRPAWYACLRRRQVFLALQAYWCAPETYPHYPRSEEH